jgi:hypothetical protein
VENLSSSRSSAAVEEAGVANYMPPVMLSVEVEVEVERRV